jgi:hypothetical protein
MSALQHKPAGKMARSDEAGPRRSRTRPERRARDFRGRAGYWGTPNIFRVDSDLGMGVPRFFARCALSCVDRCRNRLNHSDTLPDPGASFQWVPHRTLTIMHRRTAHTGPIKPATRNQGHSVGRLRFKSHFRIEPAAEGRSFGSHGVIGGCDGFGIITPVQFFGPTPGEVHRNVPWF